MRTRPAQDAQTLLYAAQADSPGAYRLAVLASLAARAEPQLIRALRLRLAPDLGPWAEADLWASPLAAMRGASGLVFDRDVTVHLRRALVAEDLCDAAWAITQRVHAGGAPALLAEEELGYLALTGIDGPEAQARATLLLRQLVSGLVDAGISDGAQWAAQALPRLPQALFDLPEAKMLALGSAYRGAALPEGFDTAIAGAMGDGAWLRPVGVTGKHIAIRLVEGGVEIGPSSLPMSHVIDLPPLHAPALRLYWRAGETEVDRRVPVDPNQTTFVEGPTETVDIEVIGGESYRLTRQQPQSAFVKRNRAPRVRFAYPDPSDESKEITPPFVIGVLADLRGNDDMYEPMPFEKRVFVEVDIASIAGLLAEMAPTLSFTVPIAEGERMAVQLRFADIEDFRPSRFLSQIPAAAVWLEERAAIAALMSRDADTGGRDIGAYDWAEAFYKAGTDDDAQVAVLDAALETVEHKLGDLAREVLHAPMFRALEVAWRGLFYLVNNVDTSEDLRIEVMSVTKGELLRDAHSATPGYALNRAMIETKIGTWRETPFACLLADFRLGDGEEDGALADALAQNGATGLCPVIANAGPALYGAETWDQVIDQMFTATNTVAPAEDAFAALRGAAHARFLGLCVGRHLARAPYGHNTAMVDDVFNFEEVTEDTPTDDLLWMNSSYAMGINIARAYKEYGWPVRIRGVQSGGTVSNLPTVYRDVQGVRDIVVMDYAFTDRAEAMLAKAGLSPLVHRKNTDTAAFLGAMSFAEAKKFTDDEAQVAANMETRLPFTFAHCAVARVAAQLARDRLGTVTDRNQLEYMLQAWLNQYVSPNPDTASEAEKARRPLSDSRVVLHENDKGEYVMDLTLKVTFQMEGMDVPSTLSVMLQR
ncbi:MAG: type VI secretion system contractile sheath large subunit [Pseudomonadota bacterium]